MKVAIFFCLFLHVLDAYACDFSVLRSISPSRKSVRVSQQAIRHPLLKNKGVQFGLDAILDVIEAKDSSLKPVLESVYDFAMDHEGPRFVWTIIYTFNIDGKKLRYVNIISESRYKTEDKFELIENSPRDISHEISEDHRYQF